MSEQRITREMQAQMQNFEDAWKKDSEQAELESRPVPIDAAMKQEIEEFKEELQQEIEDVPTVQIRALVCHRNYAKKAKKCRDALAAAAPYGSQLDIGSLPVHTDSSVKKNIMYAVDSFENRIFKINVKTFVIEVVPQEQTDAK
jgi:hypothetical protein